MAGKIPFWWVVPPGILEEAYLLFWHKLREADPYAANDFIDLGYLGDVSREEFLGTALWQLSKGIKDPFKALLKMAMMERYLSDGFEERLLCDVVKERVLTSKKSMREMDPYLLMVETVLDFYEKKKKLADRDLLRKAFYVKAGSKITRTTMKRRLEDYKSTVFKELVTQWEWPLDLTEELNQMEHWSYSRQFKFSKEINRFFFSTYRRLSGILNKESEQAIGAQDLHLLGRKISVLFVKQKNKLQQMSFLRNRRLILDKCIFQYFQDRSGVYRWIVYDGTRYPLDRKRKVSKIFSAERIVEASAWLVINGLYDSHQTMVEMPNNQTGISLKNLTGLLKHIEAFFLPAVQQKKKGTEYGDEARIEKVLVVVHMEKSIELDQTPHFDIIHSNTWGEVFTEKQSSAEGVRKIKEYVHKMDLADTEELTSKVKIHIPESINEMTEKRQFYHTFFKSN